jgi:hypothetical protein
MIFPGMCEGLTPALAESSAGRPLTLRQAQGEGMRDRTLLSQSLMLSLSKHEGRPR